VGTVRRVLTIGPRDAADRRWLATLTVHGDEPQVFVLAPVASWHDVVDHETAFEADHVQLDPGTLREMLAAGVGPPLSR
jgi:hypothetical protein